MVLLVFVFETSIIGDMDHFFTYLKGTKRAVALTEVTIKIITCYFLLVKLMNS